MWNANNAKIATRPGCECPNIIIVPKQTDQQRGRCHVVERLSNDCRTTDVPMNSNTPDISQNPFCDNSTAAFPCNAKYVSNTTLPTAKPNTMEWVQRNVGIIKKQDKMNRPAKTALPKPLQKAKRSYVCIPDKMSTACNKMHKRPMPLPIRLRAPIPYLHRPMPCLYTQQPRPLSAPIHPLSATACCTPLLPHPEDLHRRVHTPRANHRATLHSNKKSYQDRSNLLNIKLSVDKSTLNELLIMDSRAQIRGSDKITCIDLTSEDCDDNIINKETGHKEIEKDIIPYKYPVHHKSVKPNTVPVRGIIDNICWPLLSNNTNLNVDISNNKMGDGVQNSPQGTTPLTLTQEEILSENYYAELSTVIEKSIEVNLNDQHLEGKEDQVNLVKICDNTVSSSTESAIYGKKRLHLDSPVAKRPRYIPISEKNNSAEVSTTNFNILYNHIIEDSSTTSLKNNNFPADLDIYALPSAGSVKSPMQYFRDGDNNEQPNMLDVPLSPRENIDFLDDIDIDEIVDALKSCEKDQPRHKHCNEIKENVTNHNDNLNNTIENDVSINLSNSFIVSNKYVHQGMKILENISIRTDNIKKVVNLTSFGNEKCTENCSSSESSNTKYKQNNITHNKSEEIIMDKKDPNFKFQIEHKKCSKTSLFQIPESRKVRHDSRVYSNTNKTSATVITRPKGTKLTLQNKLTANDQQNESNSNKNKIRKTKRAAKENQDSLKSPEENSKPYARKGNVIISNKNCDKLKEKGKMTNIKHRPLKLMVNKNTEIDKPTSLQHKNNLVKANISEDINTQCPKTSNTKVKSKIHNLTSGKIVKTNLLKKQLITSCKKYISHSNVLSTKTRTIRNSNKGIIVNSKFSIKNFTIPKITKTTKCKERNNLNEKQRIEISNSETETINKIKEDNNYLPKYHHMKIPNKHNCEHSQSKNNVDSTHIKQKDTISPPDSSILRVFNELTNDPGYCELTEIKDEVHRLLAGLEQDDQNSKVTVTTISGKSSTVSDKNQIVNDSLDINDKKIHKRPISEADKSNKKIHESREGFDRKRKSTLFPDTQKAKRPSKEINFIEVKSNTAKEKNKCIDIIENKLDESVELCSKSYSTIKSDQLNMLNSLCPKTKHNNFHIRHNINPAKLSIEAKTTEISQPISMMADSKIKGYNNKCKNTTISKKEDKKMPNKKTSTKLKCEGPKEKYDQKLSGKKKIAGQSATEGVIVKNSKHASQNSSEKVAENFTKNIDSKVKHNITAYRHSLVNNCQDANAHSFSKMLHKEVKKLSENEEIVKEKQKSSKTFTEQNVKNSTEKLEDQNTILNIVGTAVVQNITLSDTIIPGGSINSTVNAVQTNTEQIIEKTVSNENFNYIINLNQILTEKLIKDIDTVRIDKTSNRNITDKIATVDKTTNCNKKKVHTVQLKNATCVRQTQNISAVQNIDIKQGNNLDQTFPEKLEENASEKTITTKNIRVATKPGDENTKDEVLPISKETVQNTLDQVDTVRAKKKENVEKSQRALDKVENAAREVQHIGNLLQVETELFCPSSVNKLGPICTEKIVNNTSPKCIHKTTEKFGAIAKGGDQNMDLGDNVKANDRNEKVAIEAGKENTIDKVVMICKKKVLIITNSFENSGKYNDKKEKVSTKAGNRKTTDKFVIDDKSKVQTNVDKIETAPKNDLNTNEIVTDTLKTPNFRQNLGQNRPIEKPLPKTAANKPTENVSVASKKKYNTWSIRKEKNLTTTNRLEVSGNCNERKVKVSTNAAKHTITNKVSISDKLKIQTMDTIKTAPKKGQNSREKVTKKQQFGHKLEKTNICEESFQNTTENIKVATNANLRTAHKNAIGCREEIETSTGKVEGIGKLNDTNMKCGAAKLFNKSEKQNYETSKTVEKQPYRTNVHKNAVQKSAERDTNINDKYMPIYEFLNVSIGQTLYGRFNVKDILHTGSNSCILQAEDKKNDNAKVALKVLKQKCITWQAYNSVDILKILEKADRSNTFHVINIQHMFMSNVRWCVAMEYLERNLTQALDHNRGGFNLFTVQELSRQLFKALMLLRVNQIIHSDIKPTHILVNSNNTMLKLCGFDQATQEKSNRTVLATMGTLNYRAPELIMKVDAGYPMDIWSAACCMYEMATKQVLFKGASDDQVLGNITQLSGEKRINCWLMRQKSRLLRQNLSARLFAAYNVSGDTSTEREVTLFMELLCSMLCLDYQKRVSIEYAYLNPFIYK